MKCKPVPFRVRSVSLVLLATAAMLIAATAGCPRRQGSDKAESRPAAAATQQAQAAGPRVRIVTLFPHAMPEDVEQTVTVKVEEAIAGLADVREIRSCSEPGLSTVELAFSPRVDADEAALAVRDKLDRVVPMLPVGAERPVISLLPASSQPAATVDIYGDVPNHRLLPVVEDVEDRLLGISGVLDVKRIGGGEWEIRVEIDPQRLRAFGLTAAEIVNAIQTSAINVPLLRPDAPDRPATQHPVAHDVSLASVVVATRDGLPIRLSNVATVHEETKVETIVRTDGRASVLLEVFARSRDDAPGVARQVEAVLAQQKPAGPEGVRCRADIMAGGSSACISLTAECTGMPIEAVSDRIVLALEAFLRQAEGVEHIRSIATPGRVSVQASFRAGTDRRAALRAVRSRLADFQGVPGMAHPAIEPFPPEPLARVDVLARGATDQLEPIAADIQRQLDDIAGVARIDAPALAAPRPEFQVQFDREKLARHGLDIKQVSDFLTVFAYGGREVGITPSEQRIIVSGGNISPNDIGSLLIATGHGHSIPLSEIASVQMVASPAILCRVNSRRSITLDIFSDGLHEPAETVAAIRTIVADAAAKHDALVQVEVSALKD